MKQSCLFGDCGKCPSCEAAADQAYEARKKNRLLGVSRALDTFQRRVDSGEYVSPAEKREKQKQR